MYGDWEQKKIKLDLGLRVVEDDVVRKFAESLNKTMINGFDKKANQINKNQGIAKADAKDGLVGMKFEAQEAIAQLSKIVKEIKARQKKKGEVQEDKEYNGLKNLARLCFRQHLEHEYIQDLLKQNHFLSEIRYKDLIGNPQNLMLGSYSTMLSTLVSSAQSSKTYTYDDSSDLWMSGRLSSESFLFLLNASPSLTSIVLPGISFAFADKKTALSSISKQLYRSQKQTAKCMYQINHKTSSLKPMSVRTFLQEDDQHPKVDPLPDAAFQRLKLKFTGISAVDGSSLEETTESKTFLEKVKKNPGIAPTKDFVFVFKMEALPQNNNPNTASQ